MKRALRIIGGLLLVLLSIVLAAGATYRPSTELPSGQLGHLRQIGGQTLRVHTTGAGRDVLFIHGSPGTIEDAGPLLGVFAHEHRVTAFDRPGHGFSLPGAKPPTYETHAEAALAVIDELKLQRVVVVGHSFGGTTALAAALRKHPQVAAVVVLDSAVYGSPRLVEPLYRVLALPLFGTGLSRLLGPLVGPQKIRRGIEQVYAPLRPTESFVQERVARWSSPKVNHTLADERVHANDVTDRISPHYPEITVPVWIVSNGDDPSRRETAERLARAVPHSNVRLLHHTGHYVQYEAPNEVLAAVHEALQATEPAAATP